MVFSSYLFCCYFLPGALGAYYACLAWARRWRNLVLIALSYLFYGWANPAFVLLLIGATLFDYGAGLIIAEQREAARGRARLALAGSIAVNLGVLGAFKYLNFGLEAFGTVARALGLGSNPGAALQLVLPLGISFYTFQAMSYTIDVYRGRTPPARRFSDYACYIALFPQLVAGPIVRFGALAGQLRRRTESLALIERGLAIFIVGLAKKLLLANPCGVVADTVFNAAGVTPIDAWLGLLAFAFQIYFDFSGYSEMAVGLGLMFGFRLPKNFNHPYRARSLQDFWRRWHITLSRWFRDYLYIPLGGDRRGAVRTGRNLIVVMTLAGLWHGAAWTFVCWGAFHGLVLAGERMLRRRGWRPPRQVGQAATFLVVLAGWLLFRSQSLESAGTLGRSLLFLSDPAPAAALAGALVRTPYNLLVLATAAAVVWLIPRNFTLRSLSRPVAACLLLLLLLASLTLMALQGYRPFIYFYF